MNAERMEDFAPLPWRQGDFSADYAVLDAGASGRAGAGLLADREADGGAGVREEGGEAMSENRKTLADIIAEIRANARTTGMNGHIYWLAVADRLEEALDPLLSIDLSAVSPLPWRPKAYNNQFAEDGEYYGVSEVVDADGQLALTGDGDCSSEREVEIGDWFHDGNCVAAAACVNAVAQLQADFAKRKEAEP